MKENAVSRCTPAWPLQPQYDTLLSIADQCRHEGGIGVVWARAAIEQIDYDDESMCPGESERTSAVTVASRLQAAVWPNPANDRCRVAFDRPVHGTLILRNLHGTALRSVQISGASMLEFDTANLPAGLYLIEAQTAEGLQHLTRLAIAR